MPFSINFQCSVSNFIAVGFSQRIDDQDEMQALAKYLLGLAKALALIFLAPLAEANGNEKPRFEFDMKEAAINFETF